MKLTKKRRQELARVAADLSIEMDRLANELHKANLAELASAIDRAIGLIEHVEEELGNAH